MDPLKSVSVPFEKIGGPELAALRNEEDEDHREEITLRELGECRIRAELKTVHYGKFRHTDAALVIIEFNFSKSDKIRYKSATIRIAFNPPDGAKRTLRSIVPEVCDLFPSTVYGIVTEDKKKWNWNASFGLSAPSASPVGVTGQIGVTSDSEYVVGHRMEIHGDKTSNRITGRPNNVAEWKLSENEAQQAGIPHKFVCATIVKHHGAVFHGDVFIKVTTGGRKWYDPIAGSQAWIMQAWPWEKDDPIKFDPAKTPGTSPIPKLDGKDLATLSEEDRRSLAPLVPEYQVILL
jgi:hypothetical protein